MFIDFKVYLLIKLVTKITIDRVLILRDMNINISPDSNDELKTGYFNLMAQMGFVSCKMSMLGLTRIMSNKLITYL